MDGSATDPVMKDLSEREPIADVPNALFLLCGLTVLVVMLSASAWYVDTDYGEALAPAVAFALWPLVQVAMIYGLLWFKRWAWPLALAVYSVYLVFWAYVGSITFVFVLLFMLIYVFSQGPLYMSGWE